MTAPFYEAVLAGDRAAAESALGTRLPAAWPPVSERRSRRWLGMLREDPERGPWLARAIVEPGRGEMIGHIGFHDRPGAPDLDGIAPGGVEIGYSVFEPFRGRGYAKEAAGALMGWAHDRHGITRFVASVSPENAPSLAVIAALGFERVGEHLDVEDGLEHVFVRRI